MFCLLKKKKVNKKLRHEMISLYSFRFLCNLKKLIQGYHCTSDVHALEITLLIIQNNEQVLN